MTSLIAVMLLALPGCAQSPETKQVPEPEAAIQRGSSLPADLDEASPARSALTTMFSPSRAPKRKTMGLLQRSFLDLADQGDQELEVAIVVDGTDSMTAELAGVRESIHQMLDDLRKFRNNDVRAALVVYRDAGSPSGDVVVPLAKFTSDKDTITEAVQALQPESGAPFFHELPDLGLHTALTKLKWSESAQVTKWVLMFGDAPPYSVSFKDKKTPQAFRRYATPLLVSIAQKKNIQVNCVLCTSSDNVSEPYDKAIDETRTFMNDLCAGTDGLMLDLSYPEIRTALIDAGKQPEAGLAAIPPISAIDLAAVRRDNLPKAQQVKNVSLAVVPHLPINQITFDPRNPAVLVSTALRTKLAKVPGVRISSPRDIKQQLRRLRVEGVSENQAIRGLAGRLGVDYVVWGKVAPNNAGYESAAYRRDDGAQIKPIKLAINSSDQAYVLIQASTQAAPGDQALSQLFKRMEAMQSVLAAPMADNVATSNDLLTSLEALDQALAYESGSEESVELLQTADVASKNAMRVDPRNPLGFWLQSNVAYNQASRLYRRGDLVAAKNRMKEMKSALSRSMDNLDRLKTPALATEIRGDFFLLIKGDSVKALPHYIAMTERAQPLQTQLRGHWMLAGIYAGDWATKQKPTFNPEEARRHITEILANWPDSPETKLLKEWLRWDETQEQTEFNYLPKLNAELSDL
ncbi:MAG: vWA domain-containing protein [Rubripirellula sp.]